MVNEDIEKIIIGNYLSRPLPSGESAVRLLSDAGTCTTAPAGETMTPEKLTAMVDKLEKSAWRTWADELTNPSAASIFEQEFPTPTWKPIAGELPPRPKIAARPGPFEDMVDAMGYGASADLKRIAGYPVAVANDPQELSDELGRDIVNTVLGSVW